MNRFIGFPSVKGLEKFKALHGSNSGGASSKAVPSSSLASSDSGSIGNFASLKLTAEKLVREQASTKTELDLANSKLKKSIEQIHILEEKLQGAFNENSKLKVKLNEDEKLWKGLDSKFSSSKALCDQLTETLLQLNLQVQQAEKDRRFFEEKISSASAVLDELQQLIKSLSSKLNSSEERIRTCEKELTDLGLAKEKIEAYFRDEQNKAACLIEEKDGMIKQLEKDAADNKFAMDGLTSKLEKLVIEVGEKEADLINLRVSKDNLERVNKELLARKDECGHRLEMAHKEIMNLEDFVTLLVAKLNELENQTLAFSDEVARLVALFDSCVELSRKEKDLAIQSARKKFDHMHDEWIRITSDKNALQIENHELSNKVQELHKEQEFSLVQHADECRLADEKIQKLEFNAETLRSRCTEMQELIIKLEDNLRISSENSALSNRKMQDLLLKYSELEKNSKECMDGLRADMLGRQGEIDHLQMEKLKGEEMIESLEKRVGDFENALEEKRLLILELTEKEKQFADQKAEIMASLAETERKLEESKKQYDHMLEIRQHELSKHFKEISLRNDEAISEIRRNYEAEKEVAVNAEKQKAAKVIQDMEKNCEDRLAEYKEESRKQLLKMEEEYNASILNYQQEHANKEGALVLEHTEELKHAQLQAESNLREKVKSLRSEHEAQLRAMRCEHEDECRRLQEELDMQMAKEERQKALLHLQWKVMSDHPQEEQEVTSRKNYSFSSVKRGKATGRRIRHAMNIAEDEEKESPYLKATQSPPPHILENTNNANAGSPVNMPTHSRKVTHDEYEIETSNGRTITKRRKTRSTVMFGEPRKHRTRTTPKVKTPRVTQAIAHQKPSNIGDLFTEGSLNPYVNDPFAFD